MNAGTHRDIKILSSSNGSNIKDEEVESLLEFMQMTPSAKYKIAAIKNADKLTIRAQNRLLKSLEEPEDFMIYLLETNQAAKLLETIISRAIVINLAENQADSLLENINNIPLQLVRALGSGDYRGRSAAIKEIKKDSKQLAMNIGILTDFFHRMLVYKMLGEPANRQTSKYAGYSNEPGPYSNENADALQKIISEESQNFEIKQIMNLIELMDEVIRNLEGSGNLQLNTDKIIYWQK